MQNLVKGKTLSKIFAADNRRGIYDIMNSQILEMNLPVDCVFLGDSITEFWEVSNYFSEFGTIVNRGIGGDVIFGVASRFDVDVLQLKPKVCSIMIGVNDLGYVDAKACELLEKYDNYQEVYPFIDEYIASNMLPLYNEILLKSKKNNITILLCSVMPAAFNLNTGSDYRNYFVIELNKRLNALADEYNVDYVDFHSSVKDSNNLYRKELSWDRLHPHGKGYKIMVDILKPYLRKYLIEKK